MTQAVIFRVAGALYALPSAQVAQVVPVARVSRVPHAEAPFDGLAVVCGRLLPVMQLGPRLGHPPVPAAGEAALLVVDWRGDRLALRADAIEDAEAGASATRLELESVLAPGRMPVPVPTHEV